jgi:hypothetical protein
MVETNRAKTLLEEHEDRVEEVQAAALLEQHKATVEESQADPLETEPSITVEKKEHKGFRVVVKSYFAETLLASMYIIGMFAAVLYMLAHTWN